jgi:hypothetical protein
MPVAAIDSRNSTEIRRNLALPEVVVTPAAGELSE